MTGRGRRLVRAFYVSDENEDRDDRRTKGGLRYSMPMLRALREVLRMSFMRLYLSTLKLRVGPDERRIMRRDGAIGVRVNASRCVTWSAGARVR